MPLTTVVEKLKYDNLKLSKSVKKPKNQKGKGTKSQSGRGSERVKYKDKGNKDRKMIPQDKWKLGSPKNGAAKT